jgi:hypothetical protein
MKVTADYALVSSITAAANGSGFCCGRLCGAPYDVMGAPAPNATTLALT